MTPEALTALTASIEHWKKNLADPENARTGVTECALCALFFDNRCSGCPVARRTGVTACRGTPYAAAAEAGEIEDWPAFDIAAKAEIEFLERLLPGEDTT